MIVAVKLGGAAITNKNKTCEYSLFLDTILDQVQEAYMRLKSQRHQLILIHGAGSFGHPQFEKNNLKSGWSSSPTDEQSRGLSHIRTTLQQLNTIIITGLEQRGLPVMALSPINYVMNHNYNSLMKRVSQYLDLGFVPVLHGDVVLNDISGCTVLSGDAILYELSKCFSIARCVFVTDVCGIFKADPKLKQSPESFEIVPHVTYEMMIDTCLQSSAPDVTGGMLGKINWAKRIVKECETEVVLCQWGTTEALDMMCLKNNFTNKMTRFSLF